MTELHQNLSDRNRRLSGCRVWYVARSKESSEREIPFDAEAWQDKREKIKIPRLPFHIKIHKSVAAFALAGCPQTIIDRGLGIIKHRKFSEFWETNSRNFQIGAKTGFRFVWKFYDD